MASRKKVKVKRRVVPPLEDEFEESLSFKEKGTPDHLEISQERFPFIEPRRFKRMLQKKDPVEEFEVENSIGEEEFDETVKRLSMEENIDIKIQPSNATLKILLVGKTGSGKSATANCLFSDEKGTIFKESFTAHSVTKTIQTEEAQINGLTVEIMDTPGFFDTRQKGEDVIKVMSDVITTWSEGFHALLYVINFANPRFTEEEEKVLSLISERFGKNFVEHCIVVFTHGEVLLTQNDDCGNELTLNQFCSNAGESTKAMNSFIKKIGSNIIAVNNASDLKPMRQRNRQAIIALVQNISSNGNRVFTNDIFTKAQIIKRRVPDNVLSEAIRKHLFESLKLNPSYIYRLNQTKLSKDFIASVQNAVITRGNFETEEVKSMLIDIIQAESDAFKNVFDEIASFWQKHVFKLYTIYNEIQCSVS